MKIRQIMALTGATVVWPGRPRSAVRLRQRPDERCPDIGLQRCAPRHWSVQHADDPDGRDGGCFLHPVRQGKESDSRYFTTGGRKRDDPDGNGSLDVPYSR